MEILLVDCALGALPGHSTRSARLPDQGGIVDVRRLLEGGAPPDLLVQQERLGARIFLRGLETLDCPKVFWAVDSHLNMAWHRWYARLFDLVLTPHASLFAALPEAWRAGPVRAFSCPGYRRAWRPHPQRGQTAAFVGVVDGHRPQRRLFADLLRERHGVTFRAMPHDAMLDFYDDTRILPNEAICGEFNFRAMEGASCGCCVLTPDIGEDLEANFAPGQEVLTYRHALELDELLSFLRVRPALAERVGQAAQRRVQRQHLPEHRAAALSALAPTVGAHVRDAGADRRHFALALLQWARGRADLRDRLSELMALADPGDRHPDMEAMRLRLLVEEGRRHEARQLLDTLAPSAQDSGRLPPAGLLDAHTACAVAACRLGDMPLFLRCWRPWRALCPEQPEEPRDMFGACLAWAALLEGTGRLCQPGFDFAPGRHCPETALELLLMAGERLTGEDARRLWTRRLAACCDRTPLAHLGMSFHARASLDSPADWREGLAYALACLRNFRLEAGLAEAAAARDAAAAAGESRLFAAAAAALGMPAGGLS